MRRRAGFAAALSAFLALTGCTDSGPAAGEPHAAGTSGPAMEESGPGASGPASGDLYRTAFEEVTLPATAAKVLRDAVRCGNRWYVVGALQPAGEDPRPAAWESTDGRTWRNVTTVPLPGSFYGPRNVLYSVACSNGRIAAIGAQSGGAHGNPRTSTWYQRSDGVLAEAPAPFELYGGDAAVDVGRISGGPAGFLITGNRTSGPAAWLSPDGSRFVRHELGEKGAFARDGAVLGNRYVLVGAVASRGAVWESADGITWSAGGRLDAVELQRLVTRDGDLIAVGQRGSSFAAWRRHDGRWSLLGLFGRATPTGARSVTVAEGRLAVSADRLWTSPDGTAWWEIATPAPPVAVAGSPGSLLMISTDRAWTTRDLP